jgi:hypothetical protein
MSNPWKSEVRSQNEEVARFQMSDFEIADLGSAAFFEFNLQSSI